MKNIIYHNPVDYAIFNKFINLENPSETEIEFILKFYDFYKKQRLLIDIEPGKELIINGVSIGKVSRIDDGKVFVKDENNIEWEVPSSELNKI